MKITTVARHGSLHILTKQPLNKVLKIMNRLINRIHKDRMTFFAVPPLPSCTSFTIF